MKNFYNKFIKCVFVAFMVFSTQSIYSQNIELTFNSGSYDGEVGFEIIDPNGNSVLCNPTGGANLPDPTYSLTGQPLGVYEVYGYDVFGDGWDGASLTISSNGSFLGDFDLSDGPFPWGGVNNNCATSTVSPGGFTFGTFTVAANSTAIDFQWVTGGGTTYDDEIGYEIIEVATGNKVHCDPTGLDPVDATVTLDAGDYTVVMHDNWGDGWNGGSALNILDGANLLLSVTDPNLSFSYDCNTPAFSALLGTFELVAATCEIECPNDITVNTVPGRCDADVSIDAPNVIGSACFGAPVATTPFSTAVTSYNTVPGGFSGSQLDDTPSQILGAVTSLGDVSLDLTIRGDHGFSTETIIINGPDGFELFNGYSPDCVTAQGSVVVPAGTWNDWVSNFGPDLTFTLVANSNVDVGTYCPSSFYTLTANVVTTTVPYLNDYNNTADATDVYDLGETTVNFSAGNAQCSFTVTVNDANAPTLNCPGDLSVDLEPGDCSGSFDYSITAEDDCPTFRLQDHTFNNWAGGENPPAIDAGYGCDTPGGEATYFRVNNLGGGLNINALQNELESIDLALASMAAGESLTVSVYQITAPGPPSLSALSLINSTEFTAPVTYSNEIVNIPVGIEVPGGIRVAIGVTVSNPTEIGFDTAGGTGNTWILGCGNTELLNPGTGAGTIRGMIMRLKYKMGNVSLVQTDNSGLTAGDVFNPGSYVQSYTATDANGNSTSCSFNITVTPFTGATSALACNDNVQISLPESGTAVVTSDMILEGGPYGCYDDYEVSVDGAGNVVDCSNVGQTLQVMITDANSTNTCWGNITVEDKIDPIIECFDYSVDCNTDLTTYDDSVNPTTLTVDSGADPNQVLNVTRILELDLTVPVGATVEEVTLDVDISHTFMSDLDIVIVSPNGTEVRALANGNCGTREDILATFVDGGNAITCSTTSPTISGNIAPVQPLANFTGEEVTGVWKVRVRDISGTDAAIINNVALNVTYTASNDPIVTEACDYSLSYDEITTDDDCSGDVGTIERTYTVVDASGNSASCVQTITIERPSMSDLALPVSYNDLDSPSLDCAGSWDANGNGYPDLDETGIPTLNGEAFVNGGPCGFTSSHTDLEIPLACGGLKVRRRWIIIDWCTNEEVEYDQYIVILDTTGPALDCPSDMVIEVTSGNPFNPDYQYCSGNVVVPAVGITGDDCSGVGEAETQLWTADGSVLLDVINANGGVFADVEIKSDNNSDAAYIVRHVVYDNCGNASTCEYNITTVDKVAPTAVCIEVTTTSLTTNGISVVPAVDFDNGSYDNCGEVYFLVLRNDEFANPFTGDMLPLSQWRFDESVEFDCEDVDESLMVTLLVLDIDPADLPQTPVFFDNQGRLKGSALNGGLLEGSHNMCMVEILVEDKIAPTCAAPSNQTIDCDVYYNELAPALANEEWAVLDAYGTGATGDNCTVIPGYEVTYNVDQCGDGDITRKWTADDASGNGEVACTQVISVEHNSNWTVEFSSVDQVEVECADAEIEEVAPVITNDACEMIATSYTDTQFEVVGSDHCMKIFRDWTVINWCAYDGEANDEVSFPENDATPLLGNITGEGYATYTQVIKVVDNTAPEVTTNDALVVSEDADACTTDIAVADVEALFGLDSNCGDVEDYHNFGDLEPYLNDAGTTFVGVPAGTYEVSRTSVDACGNSGTAVNTVTVEPKAPTAYCTDELVIDLMVAGMAEVNAADFNFASSDNCTATGDLSYAFSSDITNTVMTVTCDNLGANTVEMWVFDAAGMTDYCVVTLTVQNNNGADCGTGTLTVAGAINTEDADAVSEVEVEVNGGLFATSTDADGLFTFDLAQGGDYTVAPSYDVNVANGVTTFDIVKVTRHILGIESLDSAYKVIAADANNSASVTTLDIVSIRKVILQIEDAFPDNTSWRFVDAAYTFADPMNPWGFAEVVNVNNLEADALSTDFVAVKVGDVTGDAQTSFGSADDRTKNGAFAIDAKEVAMTAGNTYEVTFTADAAVEGFQFTMNFDAKKVAFVGLAEGVATAENFGFAKLNEGAITASWNADAAYDFAGAEVFTVSFTALEDVNLSEAISINSRFTAAEAYAAGELQDVALTFSGSTTANYALYQNMPNPFKGETVIAFELAEAGNAVVTIMDVNGKVVRTINGDFAKGFNNVTVKDINTTGVLYYTLESGDFTATKKMIIIE
jgi:subtilisin-like proprotein convertase family protein